MRRRVISPWLLLLVLLSAAYAVHKEYVEGRILEVKEAAKDRVLLYLVNTPIMTEDPYLSVSVEVNGTVYEGEYVPFRPSEILSGLWTVGETVRMRMDNRHFYLKRPDGHEVKFLIVRKSPAHSARDSQ